MIPNYASINETIESGDRWKVSVIGYPGQVGWTTHRTMFAGAAVSFDVEFWPSLERATVSLADLKILSVIPIPHPPQPFWADPSAEMLKLLPSNVIPFPQHRVSSGQFMEGRPS